MSTPLISQSVDLATARVNATASRLAGWLLLMAVTFNAFLAILNGHGKAIGNAQVMACEIVILLLASLLLCVYSKSLRNALPPLTFFYLSILLFIWISVCHEMLYIKALRDMGLIVIFLLLGNLISEKDLIKTFRILTILTVIFLLQEAYLTDSYAGLFQPASYYANTRGVAELSTDSSGLFRNSLGYSGRFSFGLSDHRLSSIFLEQVSLSNFSMIMAVFTSTFWPQLTIFDRLLMVATVVLMVLGTSSRTATQLCLLILFGHFIFPRLPRYSHVLYMPLFLLITAILFYDPHFVQNDEMSGRLGQTMYLLSNLNIATLLTGRPEDAAETADSGYTYLFYTQSLMGMMAFWLYTTLILPSAHKSDRRFAHGASIYIAVNLLIGAAIFSIKVAAPLWLVGGFLYHKKQLTANADHVTVGS